MKPNMLFTSIISLLTLIVVCFYLTVFFSSFSIITWDGFIDALRGADVRFAVKLSLLTATAVITISLLIALPSAYALSRLNLPGKWLMETILDIPIALSPVAVGAMVLMFINTKPGAWLEENLVRFVFEVSGILLVQVAIVLPLCIRILKAHFDTIPESYELVARTLGYSRAKSFLLVLIPLSRSAILTATLTGFAKSLGEFGATVTVAGAISFKTQTLPVSISLSLASADLEKTFVLIFLLILLAAFNMVLIRVLVGRGPAYG